MGAKSGKTVELSELNFFWLKYAYGIYQLMLNEIVWKSYAP